MTLVYQKSFRIVYIGVIYEFLVSHCYIWSKSKSNFWWKNLDNDQVNTIFQISQKVRTNEPLPTTNKIFEDKKFIQNP